MLYYNELQVGINEARLSSPPYKLPYSPVWLEKETPNREAEALNNSSQQRNPLNSIQGIFTHTHTHTTILHFDTFQTHYT